MARLSRLRTLPAALSLLAVLSGSTGLAGSAHADGPPVGIVDGMPSQQQTDLASTDPSNFGHSPGWGDLQGGVAARPYVKSLTIVNGDDATPVVVDGSSVAPVLTSGQVGTVIAPENLCAAGQVAQPGQCYDTPNRVSLTVVYGEGGTDGHDFGHPAVPVVPSVDADTVIDMTVALNTLGKSLRWTWVNGELLTWQTSDLGQDDATVHIRFKPAPVPFVTNFPANNGCTATPIRDCEVPKADYDQLSASMVFSLDQTLDPVLTGAVFATQGAFYGFLSPGGSAASPSLDIQLASTHVRADGSPQTGELQAFLPAAGLVNLYGLLPADALSVFTTTRTGDAGSNDAPTYTAWSAGREGSDGLLVTVRGITFSAPSYRVGAKAHGAPTSAVSGKGRTTVKATVKACSAKATCSAMVYDLGPAKTSRFATKRVLAVKPHLVSAKSVVLVVSSTKLPKGHRYLLVVHSVHGKKLVASSIGAVR